MSEKTPPYDFQDQWLDEAEQILTILRQTTLTETKKWGIPVFTYNKKNIVGLAGFKNYFAVWFYDGVFLEDKPNRLIIASKGKTKALRQLRFTRKEGFDEPLFRYYLEQAIRNAQKGIAYTPEKDSEMPAIPTLLQNLLDEKAAVRQQFEALTPFKQKEYIYYITEAKQEKTRLSRLAKIEPMILEGKGLNDKYR